MDEGRERSAFQREGTLVISLLFSSSCHSEQNHSTSYQVSPLPPQLLPLHLSLSLLAFVLSDNAAIRVEETIKR